MRKITALYSYFKGKCTLGKQRRCFDTTLGDVGSTARTNRNEATKRVTAAYVPNILRQKRWPSRTLFLPRTSESLQPIQNLKPIHLTYTAFGQHPEWRLLIASISSCCGVRPEPSRWGSAPIQAKFPCSSRLLGASIQPNCKDAYSMNISPRHVAKDVFQPKASILHCASR